MPEQLRLDQRRRKRRQIQRKKRPRKSLRKSLTPPIERNEPRQSDRPRHQFLPRPRRPRDQRRHVPHPRIQRPPKPPHIARKNRFPNRGPQPRHRPRLPRQMPENLKKRPPHLKEKREQMLRPMILPQQLPVENQQLLHLRPKPPVSRHLFPPPARLHPRLDRHIEIRAIPVKQIKENHPLEQIALLPPPRRPPSIPLPQIPRQPLPHIAQPDNIRILPPPLIPQIPSRIPLHKLRPQRHPLRRDPLRRKRIAINQLPNRPRQNLLLSRHRHTAQNTPPPPPAKHFPPPTPTFPVHPSHHHKLPLNPQHSTFQLLNSNFPKMARLLL